MGGPTLWGIIKKLNGSLLTKPYGLGLYGRTAINIGS